MPLLSPGDAFPAVALNRPDGEILTLPDAFAGNFGVILFFRGSWCPYCIAQLRAFQRASDRLEEVGVQVVALSTDDEASTTGMVERLGLTFPVGHSADAIALSAATGAFVSPGRGNLESTGFVIAPFGRVVVSVYSSGAIGRLLPDDVIGLVRNTSQQGANQ